MFKSGLIVAVIALFFGFGLTLLSPVCTPCVGVILGLLAGYLAGVFDKPIDSSGSTRAGAGGGLVASIGVILGLVFGAVANSMLVGPEGAQQLLNSFGAPSAYSPAVLPGYYFGVIGSAICFSIINVILMVLLGALGGLLWWQISGKNSAQSPDIGDMSPLE